MKYLLLLIIGCATSVPPTPKPDLPVISTASVDACKTKISNRGSPPDSFIKELIEWAKKEPASTFETNTNYDIFSLVGEKLGPLDTPHRRKAAMMESIMVLAGYESSWKWNEGRDTTNSNHDTCSNEEAGIVQTSYDSNGFSPKLKSLMRDKCGSDDCQTFIKCSKSNHEFALSYTANLLRLTTRHHGPLIRRQDVLGHVRPACVRYLEEQL